MKKGKVVILSGPSGSGKTTLYARLLKDKSFKGTLVRSVSMTTRPRRPGEVNGRDYFFVTRKEFLSKRKAGQLLESQRVFQDYYGTPLEPVLRYLDKGKNVLLAIEVKGARVVKKKIPASVRIFIKPPSMAVLKDRLLKRGTEDRKGLRARLQRARQELAESKGYDYIIVNHILGECYRDLKKILSGELTGRQAGRGKKLF